MESRRTSRRALQAGCPLLGNPYARNTECHTHTTCIEPSSDWLLSVSPRPLRAKDYVPPPLSQSAWAIGETRSYGHAPSWAPFRLWLRIQTRPCIKLFFFARRSCLGCGNQGTDLHNGNNMPTRTTLASFMAGPAPILPTVDKAS